MCTLLRVKNTKPAGSLPEALMHTSAQAVQAIIRCKEYPGCNVKIEVLSAQAVKHELHELEHVPCFIYS